MAVGGILRGTRHEFSLFLLQIKSVVAVAKKVEARNDGRSPKEHVEHERIVTSETVIQSRDKENDWTDLIEQSHLGQPTLPCRRNIGPSGLLQDLGQDGKKGRGPDGVEPLWVWETSHVAS